MQDLRSRSASVYKRSSGIKPSFDGPKFSWSIAVALAVVSFGAGFFLGGRNTSISVQAQTVEYSKRLEDELKIVTRSKDEKISDLQNELDAVNNNLLILQKKLGGTKTGLSQPPISSSVNWAKGLPRNGVFLSNNPACKKETIGAVKYPQKTTAQQCAAELSDIGTIVYEGSIDGKYVLWWPAVFGSSPECACFPDDGYERSNAPAFDKK